LCILFVFFSILSAPVSPIWFDLIWFDSIWLDLIRNRKEELRVEPIVLRCNCNMVAITGLQCVLMFILFNFVFFSLKTQWNVSKSQLSNTRIRQPKQQHLKKKEKLRNPQERDGIECSSFLLCQLLRIACVVICSTMSDLLIIFPTKT